MKKNGRTESCAPRRGFFRRPYFIYCCVAVVFLYIGYNSFLTKDESTTSRYNDKYSASKSRMVQGEMRPEELKVKIPQTLDDDKDRKGHDLNDMNQLPDFDDNDDGDDEKDNDNDDDNDLEDDVNDDGGDDDDAEDDDGDDYDNDKDDDNDKLDGKKDYQANEMEEKDEVQRYLRMEHLTEDDDTSNGNKTSEPANIINKTLSAKENKTFDTFKLNMTLTARGAGVKPTEKTAEKASQEKTRTLESDRAKLLEDITNQAKELTNIVRDTLNKNKMNFANVTAPNKTKPVSENITKLLDSLSLKAQTAMGLANALLDKGKQNSNDFNKTKLVAMYSMETQDLVKTAKDVLLNTNKSAMDINFENKTKLIDKFAFNAQKLAKVASAILRNVSIKVSDSAPKLQNYSLPFEKISPVTIYHKNMTQGSLILNETKTSGNK